MNAGSVTRPIQWLSLAVRCRAHAFAVIVVRAIVSSSEIMHFFNAMHFFTSLIFPRKPTLKAAAGEAFFPFIKIYGCLSAHCQHTILRCHNFCFELATQADYIYSLFQKKLFELLPLQTFMYHDIAKLSSNNLRKGPKSFLHLHFPSGENVFGIFYLLLPSSFCSSNSTLVRRAYHIGVIRKRPALEHS